MAKKYKTTHKVPKIPKKNPKNLCLIWQSRSLTNGGKLRHFGKAEGNVGNLETLELSLGEVIVAHPLADHAWGRTSPFPFPTLVCHAGGVSIYIYIYVCTHILVSRSLPPPSFLHSFLVSFLPFFLPSAGFESGSPDPRLGAPSPVWIQRKKRHLGLERKRSTLQLACFGSSAGRYIPRPLTLAHIPASSPRPPN